MTITKKHTKRLTPLLASLLVVCIIIVVFTALELTNTTHFFHHQQAVSGTIPSSNPKAQTPTENQSGPSSKSSKNKNVAQSATNTVSGDKSQVYNQAPTGGLLIAPYGTFISNHHPNLDGSPAPSQEQSTCQTSPGASCYITFSNNGVVKTLAAQNTDNEGVAIWNWDISKAGLTEGAWEINVIASLNGTTKTAKDSMQLEVGP